MFDAIAGWYCAGLTDRVYYRFYKMSDTFPHYINRVTGIRYLGYHVNLETPSWADKVGKDVIFIPQRLKREPPLNKREISVSWKLFLHSFYTGNCPKEMFTPTHAKEIADVTLGEAGQPCVMGVGDFMRDLCTIIEVDYELDSYVIVGHQYNFARWAAGNLKDVELSMPTFILMVDPKGLIEFPRHTNYQEQDKQMQLYYSSLKAYNETLKSHLVK